MTRAAIRMADSREQVDLALARVREPRSVSQRCPHGRVVGWDGGNHGVVAQRRQSCGGRREHSWIFESASRLWPFQNQVLAKGLNKASSLNIRNLVLCSCGETHCSSTRE